MTETRNWTWHIIAGVVILIFLGLHMLIMHLDSLLGWFSATPDALNWTDVLARSKSTFFAVTYTVLLAAAIYHGLYGLRTILLELGIGPLGQRMLSRTFWLAGAIIFCIGTVATVVVYGV